MTGTPETTAHKPPENILPGVETLLQFFFSAPLLIEHSQLSVVLACLRDLLRDESRLEAILAARLEEDSDFWTGYSYSRPYKVKNGVLKVPVKGVLMNRFPHSYGSYATGYDYIEAAVKRGVSDPGVKSIIMDVDSPGGSAGGCFECSEFIASQRGVKPIVAHVNDVAASGAYAIASAADSISMVPSGLSGSIGVVSTHVSLEKLLDKQGVEVTFVYAGKYKVEGNAYQALSASAKDRWQTRVDKLYDRFCTVVATNRSIDYAAVKSTEADLYDAEESQKRGLSDRIGTYAGEVSRLAEARPIIGGTQMTQATGTAAQSTETSEAALAAAATAAVATATKAEKDRSEKAAATAAATVAAEARTNEKARFSTVMASADYKGREALGNKMLQDTGMTAVEIVAILATAPKAAEPKANPFADAMNREGATGVESDDPDPSELSDSEKGSVSILSAYRKAGGKTRTRGN